LGGHQGKRKEVYLHDPREVPKLRPKPDQQKLEGRVLQCAYCSECLGRKRNCKAIDFTQSLHGGA
jgi:hypothetical protein